MVTEHCKRRIKEREINIDLEIIEYLVKKSEGNDVAFVLGEVKIFDDDNFIILIVREYVAVTIEIRRKSQIENAKGRLAQSLRVKEAVNYPCIFQ